MSLGNPLCNSLAPASYKVWSLPSSPLTSSQYSWRFPPHPSNLAYTSPSWSASLTISMLQTELKMSRTYAILLALLTVFLVLSCESDAGESLFPLEHAECVGLCMCSSSQFSCSVLWPSVPRGRLCSCAQQHTQQWRPKRWGAGALLRPPVSLSLHAVSWPSSCFCCRST